jgi:predicted component of type VI protein secretion system
MSPASYQLVMRTGPTPGKVFPLSKSESYVGRDINNDIVISDAEISRKHARFVLQGGMFILEDLGSTNGSFVGGQRLMGPHPLRSGETIMFGENVSLVFEATPIDPNATVISSAQAPALSAPPFIPSNELPPPPPLQQSYASSPQPVQAFVPSADEFEAEPPMDAVVPVSKPKSKLRPWIFAGCGCLLVLLCLCVVVGFTFDNMNLYCKPPFDVIFQFVCK